MTPTIRDISEAVAMRFGLEPSVLQSSNRAIRIARPRQIVFFLARELTRNSHPQIARHFSCDHTTVLYGAKRIASLIDGDPDFRATVDGCREILARRGSWKAAALRHVPANPPALAS